MLVMVRIFLYPILIIQSYVHPTKLLLYLMFFICLILPNRYYLFKNFIFTIMCFLNFTLLFFMLRILSLRQCFNLFIIKMAFMLFSSLQPRQFLRFIGLLANIWHRWLNHPTSCILNLLVSNNKPAYNSRPSNFQCQTCPLEKLSRLSLGPTSHNTFAPLDLFLSDVWGPTLIFSFDAFAILSFFWMPILIIYGFILLLWNLMYFLVFIVFKFLLNADVHVK